MMQTKIKIPKMHIRARNCTTIQKARDLVKRKKKRRKMASKSRARNRK